MQPKPKHSLSYRIARVLINLLFRLIARVRVEGMEKIPAHGSFIIVSNHVGRLDAPLVYYAMGKQHNVILMVAEKYKESRFFRWFAEQLDSIWVDRFNADFGAMRAALACLKNGSVLVVAPEGTRSKSGELLEARAGASYLGVKARVPLLPVALIGTRDAEVVATLKKLRKVDILARVGDPFMLPDLPRENREEALKAYTDEIMARVAVLLPPEQRGFYAQHPRVHELLAERV